MQELKLTAAQIKSARIFLAWKQEELATKSGVSLQTIRRLENLTGIISANASTLNKLISTFEANGVTFTNDIDGSIGLTFSAKQTQKQ